MKFCGDSSMTPPPTWSESMETLPQSSEGMWGQLTLVSKGGTVDQRVLVKVYRTSLEHFVVVYPDKRVAKPVGCLNLKNARVEPLANCERSFRVVQRSCDAATLEFRTDSKAARSRWLNAMKSHVTGQTSPHNIGLSLPVVKEVDEE